MAASDTFQMQWIGHTIFGEHLDIVLEKTKGSIPSVIRQCVEYLERNGTRLEFNPLIYK